MADDTRTLREPDGAKKGLPPSGDGTIVEGRPGPDIPTSLATETGATVFDHGSREGEKRESTTVTQTFRGWTVVRQFPARSGEADIFLLEKNGENRILKLYRLGIQPKEEVLAKLLEVTASNPGIFVQVHEHGYDPASQRYFEIQEYFRQGTLERVLASRKLSEVERASFLRNAVDFLRTMHSNGILHLDLKPANILVRTIDPFSVSVADFGIASLLDEEFSKKLTQVKGTSLYQSPESLSGVVGPKSDWWSLGIILLEILGGAHPFVGMSRQKIFLQLSTKGIPLPTTLPPIWGDLLKGLLERNPDKRWGEERIKEWMEKHPAWETTTGRTSTSSTAIARGQTGGQVVPGVRHRRFPHVFLGREYSTLPELIEAFATSAEGWAEGIRLSKSLELVKWLEKNRDFDEADLAGRIIAKGEHPWLALFRVCIAFRPWVVPAWNGERLGPETFIALLRKCAAQEAREEDILFIEKLFEGWTAQTIAALRGGVNPELERVFTLAQGMMDSPMAALPLPRRAIILQVSLTGAFSLDQPLLKARGTANKEQGPELLFKIAGTTGFIPWARDFKVLDEMACVLWGFLGECHRRGLGAQGFRLLEGFAGKEEKLVTSIVTKKGFQDKFLGFLQYGELSEEVFGFFLRERAQLPWLEESFQQRFGISRGREFENFCIRYSLFLKSRTKEAALRDRLLPPMVAMLMERRTGVQDDPALLRTFLSQNPLEEQAVIIEAPDLLPRRGTAGAPDWATLMSQLELDRSPIAARPDKAFLQALERILEERKHLELLSREAYGSQGPDLYIGFSGVFMTLLMTMTGLAVLPALPIFILAIWAVGSTRRKQAREALFRIRDLRESLLSGEGGPK